MLQHALDRIDEGIMIIDTDFTIVFLNEACEEILAISREDALGKNIDEFFNHPPEHTRALQHTLEQYKEFTYDVLPYQWGKYDKFLRQRTKILRKHGEIVGAMIEFSDITEYVRETDKLSDYITSRSATIIPLSKQTGITPLQPLDDVLGDKVNYEMIVEAILRRCTEMELERLIIDLSAIDRIRAEDVKYLFQSLHSLKLIGVETAITGIKPSLARDFIEKGYSFESLNVLTFAHLHQAIHYFDHGTTGESID